RVKPAGTGRWPRTRTLRGTARKHVHARQTCLPWRNQSQKPLSRSRGLMLLLITSEPATGLPGVTHMFKRIHASRAVVALLAAGIAATAFAHHSTAEFDYTKQVTLKGTVKEVQWTNPHSFIQLLVPGEGKEPVEWAVEIGSPTINISMGWKKNSV